MVDRIEAMRTGIGYLTLVHGAKRRGEVDDHYITNAHRQLWQSVFETVTITGIDIPAESEDVVQRVGQRVMDECTDRAGAMLVGLAAGFLRVVQAYERDCPDANVADILQQISLEIAAAGQRGDPT